MQSVILKVFSCQYEAITVLSNLLCGDFIRRGLCRVIFSQELLFSERQKWDQISALPQIWCLVCTLAWWLLLFGLGCFGVRLVLGHWVSCAPTCPVGVQVHFEHSSGGALGFNLGVSVAVFLSVTGRRYKGLHPLVFFPGKHCEFP